MSHDDLETQLFLQQKSFQDSSPCPEVCGSQSLEAGCLQDKDSLYLSQEGDWHINNYGLLATEENPTLFFLNPEHFTQRFRIKFLWTNENYT